MSTVNPLKSTTKTQPLRSFPKKITPKGVGSIRDSIKSHDTSNVLYCVANAFCKNEQLNLERHRFNVGAIKDLNTKALETEAEISKILEKLDHSKKIGPLLDSAQRIAKVLSLSCNTIVGLELLSVGAPIVAGVFLTPAILAGLEQVGFFKEHQTVIGGLNIAAAVAAMGVGKYTDILADITPRMLPPAIMFLSSAVQAGSSFSNYQQSSCKAEYLELQVAEQRINNLLTNFLSYVEESFKEEEKTRKSVEHLLLTSRNLD